MTFLDLVRALGELTLEKCHPSCDKGQHRREAAEHIGALLDNPELIDALAEVRKRWGTP